MLRLVTPAAISLLVLFATSCGTGADGRQTLSGDAARPTGAPSEGTTPPPGEAKTCRGDADCPKGFSCWSRPPRGPSPGIRGSTDRPGICWSDEILKQTY